MNLADWEARLCLPREGYPPEVISCLSWGGRQDRGQARAKAEKVPIRAPPAHPPQEPMVWPSGPGRELLELFAQTGLLGGAANKEQGEGSCLMGSPPNPTLSIMGFPELPAP